MLRYDKLVVELDQVVERLGHRGSGKGNEPSSSSSRTIPEEDEYAVDSDSNTGMNQSRRKPRLRIRTKIPGDEVDSSMPHVSTPYPANNNNVITTKLQDEINSLKAELQAERNRNESLVDTVNVISTEREQLREKITLTMNLSVKSELSSDNITDDHQAHKDDELRRAFATVGLTIHTLSL